MLSVPVRTISMRGFCCWAALLLPRPVATMVTRSSSPASSSNTVPKITVASSAVIQSPLTQET